MFLKPILLTPLSWGPSLFDTEISAVMYSLDSMPVSLSILPSSTHGHLRLPLRHQSLNWWCLLSTECRAHSGNSSNTLPDLGLIYFPILISKFCLSHDLTLARMIRIVPCKHPLSYYTCVWLCWQQWLLWGKPLLLTSVVLRTNISLRTVESSLLKDYLKHPGHFSSVQLRSVIFIWDLFFWALMNC